MGLRGLSWLKEELVHFVEMKSNLVPVKYMSKEMAPFIISAKTSAKKTCWIWVVFLVRLDGPNISQKNNCVVFKFVFSVFYNTGYSDKCAVVCANGYAYYLDKKIKNLYNLIYRKIYICIDVTGNIHVIHM